uniref:ASH domain-containing protein n=1 Tax=Hymenolepis diminuta TaxID=6216 RepID=A0A0R3SVI8_HYMDI
LLSPQKFDMKSSQSVKISLKITSSRLQKIQFTLQCYSVLANKGHKKLLRECRVSAEYIEPMISIIPNPIKFCILKERGKDIENQYQTISIVNEADIETSVNLAIPEPLFVVKDGLVSQSLIYFPNLQIKEKNIDFGSIENGSSLTRSIILHNDGPIEAKYEWKLTNGSVKDNPSEPLRILTRSKSLEAINTSNAAIRRYLSISTISSLHFKDLFSVSPSSGSIKPGESISTNFKFTGHRDLSANCTATCKIIDGIDQEIELIGHSSTCDCYVTTESLSFADILFSEEATQVFRIYNAGKVPSPYYFTCDENDVNLKINPSEGKVPAKGIAEVAISVTIPRPQKFTVFAKVHLSKLTPKSIRFHGKACFPHFKYKTTIHRDANYVDNYSCEFATSLTANVLDYPLKLPTVRLNLSDIVYGEIKTAKIEYEQKIHKFDSAISIDKPTKRLLAENGLTINIGREIKVIFDSQKNKIGEIALDIPLKIHEKVIQPLQLYANIVSPELRVNPRELDFGEVYLNEAKIIAVQLHNPTPFQLSWDLLGAEIPGKSFEVRPKCGNLNPDQKKNIFIKFHPRIGDITKEEINIQIKRSESISTISCQGLGLEPRLIFKPKRIEFNPLKPNEDYDEKTIVVRNPCNFDVAFYSADFDRVHTQEENILRSFPLLQESSEVLIPPRQPGEELPEEIYDSSAQMQKAGTSKIKSNRLRNSRRGLAKQTTDPTKPSQFSNITTFKKFVEESCVLPNDSGIVILVFGSPQSGQTDLAKRLAEIYDASYLDIREFLEKHIQETSLEGLLIERIQQENCKFGLIVDNIESVKSCELLLRCLRKRTASIFAVTVTRDIESIQLADKHYEEGLKRAEKEAFEMKVKKYKAMAEWEYDNLPGEEREIVDRTLSIWKRQQKSEMPEPIVETNPKKKLKRRKRGKKESITTEDPEKLKYVELELRITEFKKEYSMICQILSTWDPKIHEHTSNKSFQQLINLDLSEPSSSAKSHEESTGIPHFLIQSKMDCELNNSTSEPIIIRNGEVIMEKPNISVVVDRLLPNLPSREEIRQNLGYGPLELKIPDPVTYEVVGTPTASEEHEEKTVFTIVNPGLMETVKMMDIPRSSSRMSVVTQSGRSTSRNSLSKGKKLLEKSAVPGSEQAISSQSYRWIVPANNQIELTIRFSPLEQGIFKDVLRFVLARTHSCILIECQGCCQVPRLIADPKILAGEYKENITELQLKNGGPHDVEVTFGFEGNESDNFVVEQPKLIILKDETKTISVFALPNSVSTVTGALIGRIKNNPEPIVFHFAADGVLPNLSIQTRALDFGRIPLNYTEKQTMSISNPTVIPISWKFEKMETTKDMGLKIYPTSGILKFLNEAASVTVEYAAPSIPEKIMTKRAFRFTVMDTRELSGSIVIQPYISVQAEAVDPNFEIGLLKDGIDFGLLKLGGTAKKSIELRNGGPFKLYYNRARPSNTKSNSRLSLGPFVIQPASGMISIGKKIEIQIECSTGSTPSNYDEDLTINILDKTTTNEISYRLSVEIIAPVLKFDNKLSIFEEHLICKTRGEFEILTNNTISSSAYIEDENCFDFGISQLETLSKGKFKIFNNSKIAIDVEFHIQYDQISNRRKSRRDDSDEPDVFKIVPSRCWIEPFQSVYLSLRFTPNSLQTFSANLQALLKGQNSNLPLFGIRGCGILPRICIVEPSRNSNDEYWLIFSEKRKSNLIELKNIGLIPCEVLVNIEETGNDPNVFKFNGDVDCGFSEFSSSIEIGTGEARSLEIVYDATKYNSNEEIRGIADRKLTASGPIEVLNLEIESDKQHLNFGTCCIGSSICRSFLLNYSQDTFENTAHSSYYFNWLIDNSHLTLEPKSGELKSGSSVDITATFQSDESIKYHLSPIQCELYPLSNLKISEKDEVVSLKADSEEGAITARSAATPRSQFRQSPKLRSKSALPRSNYSLGRRRISTKQLPVIEDVNATEENEVEKVLLDILFSVTCGYVEYECSTEVIDFPETPLHCESVQTLQIKNTGTVTMVVNIGEIFEGPFCCEVSERIIDPEKSYNLSVKYRPTKSGIDQGTLILRIPNTEDDSDSIKKIQLSGKGCNIPLFFQLSKSDYQPVSLPNDPFWNRAQTLELTTTGINNKCIRSFAIKNGSEEPVEIKIDKIKPERHRGIKIQLSEIRLGPGCSSDVNVSFISRTMETEECFVIFEANGSRVPLIIVGHTREAIAAFDKSHIDFENVLVGRTALCFVNLVNTEEIPINFKIDKTTLCCNKSSDKLTISPLNGCLQPKEKLPIKIGFSPKEERNCNYNIICKVDYRERPIRLNVKTNSLKYSVSVWILGEDDDPKLITRPTLEQVNAKDISIDFGEVFAGCEQTRLFKLINHNEFEIIFGSSINKMVKEAPEVFAISPSSGKIPPLKAALVELKFSSKSIFKYPLQRTYFLGVISILNGPVYAIDLHGNVTSNPVEITPMKLDFGAYFIQQVGLGYASKNLEILNRSPDKSIYISYATSTLPEFKCDLIPQTIEPLSSIKTNITFSPLLCKKYEGNLCFKLNERVNLMTPVIGKGVKLHLEVQSGKLNVSQRDEKGNKVIEFEKKKTSLVNLGEITAFQSSRCTVSIINKTPVPLEVTAAAILPKSKQLNEVHCETSNNHKSTAGIIDMKFLKCQSLLWKAKHSETRLQNSDLFSKEPIAEIEIFFNPRGRPIDPFSEETMLRVLTKSNPEKQVWIRGFRISGKCTAVSVVAETSTVNFGTLIVGCSLNKYVTVTNHGNKMAKFVWNDMNVKKNVLSIEPWKGYIQSGSSVNFKFTLKPGLNDEEISFKDVTCDIEDSNSLKFAIIGTVTAPSESEVIKFSCPVRSSSTHNITISNPTNNRWSIKPVFSGSGWDGETILEIPPKGTKDYIINYHPLSMTQNGVPLKAQVFFPLQNGKGLTYNLEGMAGPPEPILPKTSVEFSCGRKFDLLINVTNWLPKLQRFSVSWKASDETNFAFAGSSYFDIPGGKSKGYVLVCFAKIVASAELKVIFTNQKTGEYQFVEYQIRSTKPKPEGVIELKSPLRKTTIYHLELNNPFYKEAVVGLRSSLPELICPPEYKLRPLTGSKIKLEFKPWRVGKLKGILEVDSHDLGQSIYDLQLEALDPLPENPVKFRTSVGKEESTFVTICNPSQSRVLFTCETTDLAFHCDKSILVAANSSAQLAVTFAPTQLGLKEASLKVTSSQDGSFIFPLCGFATTPEPQGPFSISATSSTQLKVDNPKFLVECNEKVVKPQEELKMNISLKNQKYIPPIHGTVIVSCYQITTEASSKSPKSIEWVFYLKSSK